LTEPHVAQRRTQVKKIGFLSFGHWTPSPHSQVRTASDSLLQSIELAVAAEELGADGAYFACTTLRASGIQYVMPKPAKTKNAITTVIQKKNESRAMQPAACSAGMAEVFIGGSLLFSSAGFAGRPSAAPRL
jgi:hypothetical protein